MTNVFHRNILVIKLGALGDIVLALGPFAAIRERHHEANIVLLTTPAFEKFLEPSRYFNQIWTDKRPALWQVPDWLKLKSRLRKGGFTLVYDLQTSDRSGWYFRLFDKQHRPEWSGIANGCSYPHTNPNRDFMHSIERQNEQLAIAGVTSVPAADLSWVTADISRFGLQSRFVLLMPGGSPHRLAKRWPTKFYAELAVRIKENGAQPVVLGASAEAPLAEEIVSRCPEAIDLCGQTELKDIAVLARNAAGAVGNDTGPTHMAAAADCPTVVLFSGASDPALTAPRGLSVEVLRQQNLANLSIESVAAALRLR